MIKTDAAYNVALQQLQHDREAIEGREQKLRKQGRSAEEVARAMAPQYTLFEQLKDEVDWYTQARRGDVQVATTFNSVGRLLIGLRIAAGITQRELAEALGVDESQVSRDERNEYHGITVNRVDQIIDKLRGKIEIKVEPARELVVA
ncbi:MAG TPA: helix-turn-helix domain-containing protein [Candidatus Tumulicola sp.]|nr:helix-turn-helix domain-containing protein [Candidatus Tumulicola sp.]